jgi:hypothetical protein
MNERRVTVLVLAAILIPQALPAFAGSVDPETGLANLVQYGLTLAGIMISGIFVWKGVHAAIDGRHFGPHIFGLLGGLALAFGGPAIMQHYGAGGGGILSL